MSNQNKKVNPIKSRKKLILSLILTKETILNRLDIKFKKKLQITKCS